MVVDIEQCLPFFPFMVVNLYSKHHVCEAVAWLVPVSRLDFTSDRVLDVVPVFGCVKLWRTPCLTNVSQSKFVFCVKHRQLNESQFTSFSTFHSMLLFSLTVFSVCKYGQAVQAFPLGPGPIKSLLWWGGTRGGILAFMSITQSFFSACKLWVEA